MNAYNTLEVYVSTAINTSNSFLLMVLGLLIALFVKFTFEKILRTFFKKTKNKIDDLIIDFLENPVFLTIILVVGNYVVYDLSIPNKYSEIISKLLITSIVLIWAQTLNKIAAILVSQLGHEKNSNSKLVDIKPFFKTISKLISFLVALALILNIWGVDIAPFLASAGIASLAVAFASKDTISNLFGGISIFFDRPYATGDYVIIDEKYRGEVTEIGIRSTKIRTRDDVLLTVPNSVMITKAVVNETGLDGKLRVRVPIGVAQGTDLEKAESTIVKILNSHPEVLKKPEARVRFRKFGEFTVDLEALFVVSNPADRGRITHEMIKKLDSGLRKNEIKLPPPQMVVSLNSSTDDRPSK